MADMTEFEYTPNPQDTYEGFEIVPASDYKVIIEESDIALTKDGTGKILKFTYQIVEGPMKDRKIFDNLNIVNTGPKGAQTEAIAKSKLNTICKILGVPELKDTVVLHDLPFMIRVDVKESKDKDYGKQNVIKKYYAAEGVTAPVTEKTTEKTGESVPDFEGDKQPWDK